MEPLRPTTKAQVSGHRFLRRRLEHGLVMGDIRMLHDPISKRRRSLFAGMGVSVLMMAGAGIMAWLSPHPDPGAAPIVQTEQGQIFAQVKGVLYPVPNIVSAQLIAGQPAQPVKIVEIEELGAPAGIADAPGFLNPSPTQVPWTACLSAEEEQPEFISQVGNSVEAESVIVFAGLNAQPFPGFALLESGKDTWILQQEGVRRMPTGALAKVVEKALGISSSTPRWQVKPQFVATFTQLPDFATTGDLPAVWDTGSGLFARSGAGVSPITELQGRVLTMLGAKKAKVAPKQAAELPTVQPKFELPTQALDFVGPAANWLCSQDSHAVVASPISGLVPLAGTSPATHFGGLDSGGVAVDTGHGRLVVSATGTRHDVGGVKDWEALGLEDSVEVPWSLVQLLPEGSELSMHSALAQTQSQPHGAEKP